MALKLLYLLVEPERTGARIPISKWLVIQNDTTDRADLYRLVDDGCPNSTGDTQTHDLSKLLAALAKDEG